MKHMKKIALVLVLFMLVANFEALAASAKTRIEVIVNSVDIKLNGGKVGSKDMNYTLSNGDQVPFSMIYKGTTYLPIRKLSELLGIEVGWDGATNTITLDSGDETPMSGSTVTIPEVLFNQVELDLSSEEVETVALYYKDSYHDAKYVINDGKLHVTNQMPYDEAVTVEVYGADAKTTYKIEKTILPGLDSVVQSSFPDMEYVLLPGIPERGFHFPMLVCVGPDRGTRKITDKKHLFVDTLNIGLVKDKEALDNLDYDNAIGSASFGFMFAAQLDMPFMLPLIPRVGVEFETAETGRVYTYEAALDRDTIFYEEILSGEMYGNQVADQFKSTLTSRGFEPEAFENIDEQLVQMIAFANEYLEDHGYVLEDKVFMTGFSASGQFVDRFATLHPEHVRAYVGGAAADDFVLPTDHLRGQDMILPLGISDYEDAAGRAFNLDNYNSVARIIHMGDEDDNDVFRYSDAFGNDEKAIASSLWSSTPLARAYDMFDDFATTGGHGLLVVEEGVGHGTRMEMNDYIMAFYKANVGDDTPVVYPDVNYGSLDYRLFD